MTPTIVVAANRAGRSDIRAMALVVALAAMSRGTGAQALTLPSSGTSLGGAAGCLAAIKPDGMTRTPVLATVTVRDTSLRAVIPLAALVIQDAAIRVRTSLGAQADILPAGEPTITWRDLERGLIVTGFRDGHLTWRVEGDSAGFEAPRASAARLLARSLASELFLWPESLAGDSVTFDVEFSATSIDKKGRAAPKLAPVGFAVFSVDLPKEEPVMQRNKAYIHYPAQPRNAHAEGSLILQFVVDTLGRVDMSTVKDLWPGDRPRLTGEFGAYYDSFYAAVRTGLGEARYLPARVGGCKVPQLVQQPFEFIIKQPQ